MASPRVAIKQKIKQMLLDANITGVGTNIEVNRIRPVQKSQVPIILIYTNSEAVINKDVITDDEEMPDDKVLETVIEILDDVTVHVDEYSDNTCQEVQDALNLDPSLGKLVYRNLYQGVDIKAVQEGSFKMVSSSMKYASRYESLTLI